MSQRYRIAIVGAGGVGGFFGGRLATVPNLDVHFLLRAGPHFDALTADGLHVDSSICGPFHVANCSVATDAASIGPCDAVIVCVKAYSLEAVAPTLKPLLRAGGEAGPPTAVVPLLNGIGAPSILSAALGAECVCGGLCKVFAWIEAPGRIKQNGAVNDVTIGELDGSPSVRIARLSEALTQAAIGHTVPSLEEGGVHTAMWTKLAIICSMSAVGSVTRATWGQIVAEPRCKALHRQLLAEGFKVATAHGAVGLDEDHLEKKIAFMLGQPPDGTTSLHRDIVGGRVSELHAQLGEMVARAEVKGVDAPALSFCYAALLPQEQAARAKAARAESYSS